VEYDLGHNVIRLFRTKDCPPKAPLAYWAKPEDVRVVDIARPTPQENHIIADGSINGAHMRIVFDTGANRSTLTLKAAARPASNRTVRASPPPTPPWASARR
jgi:predicted aspartyl protease